MLDLVQEFVAEVVKMREAAHDEMSKSADELSRAMVAYGERAQAALVAFVAAAHARGDQMEEEVNARLEQFRGARPALPQISAGPALILADPRVEDAAARAMQEALATKEATE